MICMPKGMITNKNKEKKDTDNNGKQTIYRPLDLPRANESDKLLQAIQLNRRNGFNSQAMIQLENCTTNHIYAVDFLLMPLQTKATMRVFLENGTTESVGLLEFLLSLLENKAMSTLSLGSSTAENVYKLEFLPMKKKAMSTLSLENSMAENDYALEFLPLKKEAMSTLSQRNGSAENVYTLEFLPVQARAISSLSLKISAAENVIKLNFFHFKTKATSSLSLEKSTAENNVCKFNFLSLNTKATRSLYLEKSDIENFYKLYFLLSKSKVLINISLDKKMAKDAFLCVGFAFLEMENYSKIHTSYWKTSAFLSNTNNHILMILTKYKNINNTNYNTLSVFKGRPSRENVRRLNLMVPMPRPSLIALKLNRPGSIIEKIIALKNELNYIPNLKMDQASKDIALESTKWTETILNDSFKDQPMEFSSKESKKITICGTNQNKLELACEGHNKFISNYAVKILEAIGLMDKPSHEKNVIAPQKIVVYPVLPDRNAYLTAAFRIRLKAFNLEIRRLATFVNFPATANTYVTNLAREGFVYTGDGRDDKATCAFCNETYSNWQGKDVKAIHKQLSRTCLMAWGINWSNDPCQLSPNIPMGGRSEGYSNTLTNPEDDSVTETAGGQGTEDFLPVQESLSAPGSVQQAHSAEGFGNRSSPNSSGLTQESGQTLTCFFCEGVHGITGNIQDIWVEHAARYPSCGYVRLKYGNNFVEIVRELAQQHEQVTMEMVSEIMDLPISLGEVTVTRLDNNGYVQNSETDDVAHLLEESRLLSSRLLCCLCQRACVQILYQPCGHLVTCLNCSLMETTCLVCEGDVTGRIRVFLD